MFSNLLSIILQILLVLKESVNVTRFFVQDLHFVPISSSLYTSDITHFVTTALK